MNTTTQDQVNEYPPRATKAELAAAKKRAQSATRVLKDVAQQITKPAKAPKPPKAPKVLRETKDKRTQSVTSLIITPNPEKSVKAPALPTTPYQGPMLALRDRLKSGAYKKAANGQPSCGDDVAGILGSLEPAEVIKACCIALDITNPYLHLNIGQQSMNLRNKLRGALKNEKFGMGVLREAVEDVVESRPAKMTK